MIFLNSHVKLHYRNVKFLKGTSDMDMDESALYSDCIENMVDHEQSKLVYKNIYMSAFNWAGRIRNSVHKRLARRDKR